MVGVTCCRHLGSSWSLGSFCDAAELQNFLMGVLPLWTWEDLARLKTKRWSLALLKGRFWQL